MSKSTGNLTASTARRLLSLATQSERTSGVSLSINFIRGDGGSTPPLAQLLRGEHAGRGGEVRLKLWLSLALLAAKSPFDIRRPRPAHVWAQTLGLADPNQRGARRVIDAIDWLHEHRFVVAQRKKGMAAKLRVLYPTPEKEHRAGKNRWVIAPVQLWNQGWIVTLSGPALVALLALAELTNAGKIPIPQAMDTARRREYGLSDDTWSRASAELVAAGLITLGHAVTEVNYVTRRRTTYLVNMDKLNDGPVAALGLL